MHPDSQLSVVRWTAPHSGLFDINAMFRHFENLGSQTGFHVRHNDKELPDAYGILSGFGTPAATASYNGKLVLNTEDRIEFIVDIGPDGSSAADGVIVDASITYIPDLAGDFNGNGSLDIGDLDQLYAGIRQGNNLVFDLHKNNNLDQGDRRVWVEDLKRTYFGDTNLDGQFNSADVVAVFAIGKYENGIPRDTSWSGGDWNGDADFDSSDLVLAFSSGGYEAGTRAAVSSVPEPNSWLQLLVIASIVASRRTRKNLSLVRSCVVSEK
jgi:hypothetical protein